MCVTLVVVAVDWAIGDVEAVVVAWTVVEEDEKLNREGLEMRSGVRRRVGVDGYGEHTSMGVPDSDVPILLEGVQGSQGVAALKGDVATSVICTKSHCTSASILALLDRLGRFTPSSILTLRSLLDRFRFICFHSFANAMVMGSVSSLGINRTDRVRGDVWIAASDRVERRERFRSKAGS